MKHAIAILGLITVSSLRSIVREKLPQSQVCRWSRLSLTNPFRNCRKQSTRCPSKARPSRRSRRFFPDIQINKALSSIDAHQETSGSGRIQTLRVVARQKGAAVRIDAVFNIPGRTDRRQGRHPQGHLRHHKRRVSHGLKTPATTARASKLALQSPQPATGGAKETKRRLPGALSGLHVQQLRENRSTAAACHGSGSHSLRRPRSRCVLRLRRYTTNSDRHVPPSACKHKSAFQDRTALRSKSRLFVKSPGLMVPRNAST